MCHMGLYDGKVDGPKAITYLDQTTILEWCVVRCKFSFIHKKGCVQKRLEQCVQNTILDYGVNMIEGSIYMFI